jgi:hypothetical protein
MPTPVKIFFLRKYRVSDEKLCVGCQPLRYMAGFDCGRNFIDPHARRYNHYPSFLKDRLRSQKPKDMQG